MEKNIDLQNALDASIIFAKALGFILQNNQGIVVDVPSDSKMRELIQKVVVFKFNEKIHIYKCEDDLQEGIAVLLDMSESDETKPQ
jgi:hypothetical protein